MIGISKAFLVRIAIVTLMLIIPGLNSSPYVMQTISTAMIFSIYSMGWNLLALSGQASLGHAAFYGIGAYASLLLNRNLGIPVPLGIVLGPAISAAVGLGLGAVVLRLREWFLAMVTFGFAIIVQALVVDDRLRPITKGWDGILAEPLVPPSLGDAQIWNYYWVLLVALVIYLLSWRVFNSRFGLAFKSIRDNEMVARTSGVKSTVYKLLAFTISSYIAGLAGALQFHVISRYLTPEVFDVQTSFWPLIFTLAGGIATPEGPILGSFIVWIAWQQFRAITGFFSLLGIGVFLALIIIFLPGGLLSLVRRLGERPKLGLRA